jgi:succinyl-CoA synthetase beta subunit
MQEYVIKSQVEAYKALQNFSSAGIPAQVFAQIRSDAISRYPSDYEMQEYVIKTQIEAYKRLH